MSVGGDASAAAASTTAAPLVLQLLVLALFTFLILLALGGNVLVCAAIFLDRKLRRQPENLFLVSLAVSDLFVSVLVMVFAAANDMLGYWPFGDAYCQFWICLDITCCTASILNLCAIAFDRYLHISRPMKYARYSNKSTISMAIMLVWLLSTLLGSAQIIFSAASSDDDYPASSTRVINTTAVAGSSATPTTILLVTRPPLPSLFLSSSSSSHFRHSSSAYDVSDELMSAAYDRLDDGAILPDGRDATRLRLSLSTFDTRIFTATIAPASTAAPGSLPTCHLRLSPLYAIFSSILSFFLPAAIMVLLYTKLYLYARMHVRSIRAQLKQATSILIMQLASHTALHYGNPSTTVLANDYVAATLEERLRLTGSGGDGDTSATNSYVTVNATVTNETSATLMPTATATTTASVQDDTQLSPPTHSTPHRSMSAPPGSDPRHFGFTENADLKCNYIAPMNRSVSDQKARVTLGVIMGTFLICWLPFFVINIWRSLFPHFFSQRVFQVVTWLGYANSTANPVIYGIFNRDFRRAFSRIVFKVFYCLHDEKNDYKRSPFNKL